MNWLNKIKFSGTSLAKKKSLVGLSFDDGPSLQTIKVLEILKLFESRATFFWIVEKAVKLKTEVPEIFRQIVTSIKESGSEIGLHAPYDYRPTFLSRLFGKFTEREIITAKNKLEELTDLPVRLYRPHYVQLGRSTLFAHKLGLMTVFGDFTHYAEPDAQEEFQVRKFSSVRPGNILVFHDGNTLLRKTTSVTQVLPTILENLGKRGIRGTSISDVLELKEFAAKAS